MKLFLALSRPFVKLVAVTFSSSFNFLLLLKILGIIRTKKLPSGRRDPMFDHFDSHFYSGHTDNLYNWGPYGK